VVDAEHLRLVEDLVHRLVQRPGRVQVGAERLLDDDAGVPRQAGRTEGANDRGERGRRHGQVIKAPNGPADLLLRPLDRLRQLGRVAGSAAAKDTRSANDGQDGSVGLVMQKSEHACSVCSRNCSVVIALAGGAEPMTRTRAAAARPRAGGTGRQQLALGQIAGRAEQHDDMVIRSRGFVLRHLPAQAFFSM
jgi:hypothetical protein